MDMRHGTRERPRPRVPTQSVGTRTAAALQSAECIPDPFAFGGRIDEAHPLLDNASL